MRGNHFDGLLAGEVLYIKTKHEHAAKVLVNLMLQSGLIMRCMAAAQQTKCSQPICIIIDDVDLTKGNDTLEMGRKRLGMNLILCNDAKRAARAVADGIHLVALQCGVEIEASVSVNMTQWHSVGIATVTHHGQHARSGMAQDADALVLG